MPWERQGSGFTTKDRGGYVKNPAQYEKLRSKGMSKQRAAAITNSVNKGATVYDGEFAKAFWTRRTDEQKEQLRGLRSNLKRAKRRRAGARDSAAFNAEQKFRDRNPHLSLAADMSNAVFPATHTSNALNAGFAGARNRGVQEHQNSAYGQRLERDVKRHRTNYRQGKKELKKGANMIDSPWEQSAFSPVSKARQANRNQAIGQGAGDLLGAGAIGSGVGAAMSAKSGKKWSAGWRAGGRTTAESAAGGAGGALAGAGIGALTRRPTGIQTGARVGGLVGGIGGGFHGGNASVNNSRNKGWLKRGY
jgi:hypothetical protein